MELVTRVSDVLWLEQFQLPPLGAWWTEMRDDPGSAIYLPRAIDLAWALGLAVVISALRRGFKLQVAEPLARWRGIQPPKTVYVKPDQVLEAVYTNNANPPHRHLMELSKKTDMSTAEIANWFRKRTKKDKISKLDKLSLYLFKSVFHVVMIVWGVRVVLKENYFPDTRNCWTNMPRTHIPPSVFWLYMVQLGYYLQELPGHFYESKRKDFLMMLAHHVITALLITFSWLCNYVRVGVLVMAVHDPMDPFAYLAKTCHYLGMRRAARALLVGLIVVFFITRMFIYPYYVINSTFFEYAEMANASIVMAPSTWGRPNSLSLFTTAWGFFNILLTCLLIFNFIWGIAFLKMFVVMVVSPEKLQDVRSATESSA